MVRMLVLGLPMEQGLIYDITQSLGPMSRGYPGDKPFKRTLESSLERGDPYDLSSISMSAHLGTHIDAPSHFINKGRTIDEIHPRELILPAVLVRPHLCRSCEVERIGVIEKMKRGSALLISTRRDECDGSDGCNEGFIGLSSELADSCVKEGVKLVGVDGLSVDSIDTESYPVHRRLLGNGVLILEGLKLDGVPAGRYTLVCQCLKIDGGEASPARAVLIGEGQSNGAEPDL
jgi:arylformamidase